ncbi:class I adenylate-forming enzyme family protein [Natrarchaeobaculum aegyptiacum]|uniref:Long-chain fatty acid--CoA ligase n=1 Tax=Natrarchaeobaculum aegyptiacum TaxID=745377 RepID=A0A2Z2HTR7_9EURY|nr:AMP-binding protein [Natrarchaeobaculum aegyptiacum]ARS90636.1 long-chain fatty acid--CoA ligase [Natrarchaeobaculum aegyptiacum]
MEYHHGEQLAHMGTLPAMAADRYEDKTAFSFMGSEQSFRELEEEANSVANVLVDHGVAPGDRVGLFVPNTTQFPPAHFGIIKAGAVSTPLNLRMDPETLAYVIEDAGIETMIASAFLADEAKELAAAADVETLFLPGVADEEAGIVNYSHATMDADDEFEPIERDPDDVCIQPYTSGTTGRPKGVLLSHRNVLTTLESYGKGGLAIDADDSILLVLPMFHIYALNALLGIFTYRGGTMVLQPEPDPVNMLTAIDEHEITMFAGVPALYTMMFREYRENPGEYDLSSLRNVICAAAPLAEEVRRQIEDAWNVPVVEGWGMTETGPAGTVEPFNGVRKEAGCVGPPLPGVELKLVDTATRETKIAPEDIDPFPDPEIDFDDDEAVTGELAIRGPMVFEGYHDRPGKTEQVFDDEGWFYTEDVARIDEDGYFWIVDRADDMIITGGNNVYPAEVEDVLYEHPDVAEAAVVAAPHDVKGEAPVAFVVPEADTDVAEDEIRSFALERVATYAHPRRVFVVDELPRSATQKVQRYVLEADVEDRLEEPLQSSGEEL